MRMRAISAAAMSAAAVAGLLGTATAASAAEEPTYADIYVAIDLPTWGASGPREFETIGALVGAGPELTAADEIANPSTWCGVIDVDIDLDAETITATVTEDCYFEEIYIAAEIYGGHTFETATVVSDALLDGASLIDAGVTDGLFEAYWSTESATSLVGPSVFSFTAALVIDEEPEPAPTPVVTPSPEPVDDVNDAEAAAPVVAQPTFTG